MIQYVLFLNIIFSLFILGCNKTEPNSDQLEIQEPRSFGEFIDDWTYKVNPYGNFDIGEFRLWVPDSLDDLKAILVLSNHHNSNGLGFANSAKWQEYAASENMAILGVYLKSFPNSGGYYSFASEGSGAALVRALDSLAHKHNRHELKDLPFLMRGYSAGGVFSHNFSAYKPERVIAFSNIRGGSVDFSGPMNNDVPGLMLIGENDFPQRNDRIKEAVLLKRNEGANWSYAIQPVVDHYGGMTECDELIKIFFSKVLAKRVVVGSNELASIPEDSGWLGNNETKETFTFNSYPDAKNEASWLIDEEFAILWKAFQTD